MSCHAKYIYFSWFDLNRSELAFCHCGLLQVCLAFAMFTYGAISLFCLLNFFSSIAIKIFIQLGHILGKRRSEYFSNLADESIEAIFRLMKMPPTGSIDVLGDGGLDHLRIRLTEYSKVPLLYV